MRSRPKSPLLIDTYMPSFDAGERHERRVRGEPQRAYEAFRALDFRRSFVVRALFAIRTLPSRFRGLRSPDASAAGRPFLEEVLAVGWRILEEAPGRELVAGAVTRPWAPVVQFRGMPGPEFIAFAEPGFTKIAWNIAVAPDGDGWTLVSTETRVRATDQASRRKFLRYWFFVSPGVRLIRRMALSLLEKELAHAR